MPVRYRPADVGDWQSATTANVSHTGVLLEGPVTPIAIETRVEMVLGLTVGERRAGDVLCVGRIVRHGQAPSGRLALAATIDRFEFSAPAAEASGE